MDAQLLGLVVGWLIGAALTLAALYYVVRAAILSALREHTMSSTTAVSVTSAVPLRISGGETVAAGDDGRGGEASAAGSVQV
ncbi:hypothetical protein E4V99_14055 [Microbacterium sp. dk485]|uniref:hypothetical protein n=1 Tax=Microbacterium sp. dk485 TaxID=2560021 RepID=UPI001073DB2B|nr:hypothetical protein [Microbacterium sp. dk485]TFV82053.1 hypothetical protein E4V99_14055 [Microbacterium sp. dk485]